MKGSGDILCGFEYLRMAREHWESFCREHPGTKGAKLVSGYVRKIEWMHRDLLTNPALPQAVRDGMRKDLQSDVFGVAALSEKMAMLRPEDRDNMETLLDAILNGKHLAFEILEDRHEA